MIDVSFLRKRISQGVTEVSFSEGLSEVSGRCALQRTNAALPPSDSVYRRQGPGIAIRLGRENVMLSKARTALAPSTGERNPYSVKNGTFACVVRSDENCGVIKR